MTWHRIDFEGVVNLDKSLAEQLQRFLEEKELELAHRIVDAVPLCMEMEPPSLKIPPQGSFKLNDGVEVLSRRMHRMVGHAKEGIVRESAISSAKLINEAFYEYIEILESGAVELFQLFDQIGVERWGQDLESAVESIKDTLIRFMDDASWALKRLESLLGDYREFGLDRKKNILPGLFKSEKLVLDPSLLMDMEKCKKFLDARHKRFTEQFAEFKDLSGKIEQSSLKFIGYPVLNSLEINDQNRFKAIYRWVKFWKQNQQSKIVPQLEAVRALVKTVSQDKVVQLFVSYCAALKTQIFDKSRLIKQDFHEVSAPVRKLESVGGISLIRLELENLAELAAGYRDFLFGVSRKTGGGARWKPVDEVEKKAVILGEELTQLLKNVDGLKSLCAMFEQSLRSKHISSLEVRTHLKMEVRKILHEMAQPFSSERIIKGQCVKITRLLEQLDELGSHEGDVIDEVEEILSKALRADWKFNVLQSLPVFHQLFDIHMGLRGPCEDRNHVNRLNKFNKLTGQIKEWVCDQRAFYHMHEIELDINDIRGYLQDFLAFVQRVIRDRNLFRRENARQVTRGLSLQLLIYRYLFSGFFYELRRFQTDGLTVRNQFLFVDQYFEHIDSKLSEMRSMEWPDETGG